MAVESGFSIRAYAAHRKKLGLPGGSAASVQKALNGGRISRGPDGKIHPEVADREWSENSPRSPANQGPSIGQSRSMREAYLAQIARLDYLERIGNLVPVDEMERKYFVIARALREKLLSIPARLAADVHAAEDIRACEVLMDREIRSALEVLP